MTKYTVHGSDLHFDGKPYPEGSQIELDEQDAQKLRRYLKEASTEPKQKPSPKGKEPK